MNALEIYPPRNNVLRGSTQDYLHAANYMEYYWSRKSKGQIKTLSQSEWEVASEYNIDCAL